jgi:hypothetical protein
MCLLKTPKAAKSLEFLCRRPWSGRAENELELESQKGILGLCHMGRRDPKRVNQRFPRAFRGEAASTMLPDCDALERNIL